MANVPDWLAVTSRVGPAGKEKLFEAKLTVRFVSPADTFVMVFLVSLLVARVVEPGLLLFRKIFPME